MEENIPKCDNIVLSTIASDIYGWIYLFNNKDKQILPVFGYSLIQYLALSCEGINEYLSELKLNHDLSYYTTYQNLIKRIRLKTKLFESHRGITIKDHLDGISRIKQWHYDFYEKTSDNKSQIAKSFAWDYDLGLTSYKGHYIGNSFLVEWFFSKFEDGVSILESDKITYDIGYQLGEFIGSIMEKLKIPYYDINSDRTLDEKIITVDYSYKTFFNLHFGKMDENVKILIFHLLNIINFIIYILDELLNIVYPLSIRIKYVCYYHIINTLGYLEQYMYLQGMLEENYKEIFNKAVSKENRKYISKKFRNCMAHYSIRKEVNQDDVFCENTMQVLCNKIFHVSEDEFVIEITRILHHISNILEEWFRARN